MITLHILIALRQFDIVFFVCCHIRFFRALSLGIADFDAEIALNIAYNISRTIFGFQLDFLLEFIGDKCRSCLNMTSMISFV